MNQVAPSVQSACQVSAHASQMLVSAVGKQQHACMSTAAVWLHMAQLRRSCTPLLSIRGDSRPSRAHAAHLMPLLTSPWVFCYRTKTVARPMIAVKQLERRHATLAETCMH